MANHQTDRFIDVYQSLNKDNLVLLKDIYHQDIQFSDPLHQIRGLDNLHDYFAALYSNVSHCKFDISDVTTSDENAFLYWRMFYAHPKLNGGEIISVDGHSRLTFLGEKIIAHKDYFDVGALLYRHIPVLGSIIKYIDKRAAE